MTQFIAKHNQWVNEINSKIEKGLPLQENALDYHQHKVSYLQHERLVHLLILIFVGLVLISLFITTLFVDIMVLYGLLIILIVLFGFYIRHYYLLENTVQQWYEVTERMMNYVKK